MTGGDHGLACLLAVGVLLLAACSPGGDTDARASGEATPAGQVTADPPTDKRDTVREGERLRTASLEGGVDEIRAALSAGADVDSTDPDDRTALMLAAFNGHTDVVRFLIDRGANIAARDLHGRTALMYASTGPFVETVELLLSSGADPNVVDEGELWTALMFAAGEGQLEVVQALLARGADPTIPDDDGDTAADHAFAKQHQDVGELLSQGNS